MDEKIIKFETCLLVLQDRKKRIYEAIVDGQQCCCLADDRSGYCVLFDWNEEIFNAIIELKTIRFTNRHKFFRVMDSQNQEYALRLFLYSHYKDIPIEEIKGRKIIQNNKEMVEQQILDYRSHNLSLEETAEIAIVARPTVPSERYITITKSGLMEIQEYSDELYHDLIDGKIRIGGRSLDAGKRLSISSGERHKLSRALLLRQAHDGVIGKEIECSHLNSLHWNNCIDNLMMMQGRINQSMQSIARGFNGQYRLLPIVWRRNGEEKILVEWDANGTLSWYVCDSAELFLDLLNTLSGRNKLTRNTKLFKQSVVDGAAKSEILETPMQNTAPSKVKDYAEDFMSVENEFWKWCDGRDRILSRYENDPDSFIPWACNKNGIAIDISPIQQMLSVFGFRV